MGNFSGPHSRNQAHLIEQILPSAIPGFQQGLLLKIYRSRLQVKILYLLGYCRTRAPGLILIIITCWCRAVYTALKKMDFGKEDQAECDPWDAVVDLEGRLFEEGFREGEEDATRSLDTEHGRKAGFLKGYAIGLELGFMEKVGNICESSSVHHGHGMKPTVNAAGIGQIAVEPQSTLLSDRIVKRRKLIMSSISTFPLQNSKVEEFDFDDEILKLRALYKQAGYPAGEFLARATSSTSGNIAEASHEW